MKYLLLYSLFCFVAARADNCLNQLIKNVATQQFSSFEDLSRIEKREIPFDQQMGKTIDFVEQQSGEFDLLYTVVKKQNLGWADLRSSDDIQGDLRYIVRNLSPEDAQIFGVRFDDEKMIIPSVDEFIFRYRNWIKENHFKGMLDFYPSRVHLSGRKYLTYFAKYGMLPLARRSELYIHDLNFHILGQLVIPPEVNVVIRKKIYILLAFDEYLRTKFPQSYDKAYYDSLFEGYTKAIDAIYGIMATLMEKLNAHHLSQYFNTFFHNGQGFLQSDKDFLIGVSQGSRNIKAAGYLFFKQYEQYLQDEYWELGRPEFMMLLGEHIKKILPSTYRHRSFDSEHVLHEFHKIRQYK